MSRVSNSSRLEGLWAEMPTKERIIAHTNEGAVFGEYIELSQVLRRIQEVFGLNYEIRLSEPHVFYDENNRPLTVAMSAQIIVNTDTENPTAVQGYGAANVRNGVDNSIKMAETDAIKRAARLLGIGMFLYERETTFRPAQRQKTQKSANRTQNSANRTQNSANTSTQEQTSPPVRNRIFRSAEHVRAITLTAQNCLGERLSPDEVVNTLLPRFTVKQAWVVAYYPDLLETALTDEEVEPKELVSTAVERFANNEDWRDYFIAPDDDEDEDETTAADEDTNYFGDDTDV